MQAHLSGQDAPLLEAYKDTALPPAPRSALETLRACRCPFLLYKLLLDFT